MGYVTYSQGFKSGGFNDAIGQATSLSFDPEYLTNYEAGLKSTLYGGKIILNASVFHMEWDDIQIQEDDPNTPVFDPKVSNSGKAHSTGVEAELTYRPNQNVTININGSLIEAEFDEGEVPTGPGEPITKLDRLERIPEYNFGLSIDYEKPINNDLMFLASGEIQSQGEMFLTLDNQEDGRVSPYSLLNAQIGIGASDDSWRLVLWGQNLTDETYAERLFDIQNIDLLGQKYIDLGQPRTFGARLIKQF